MIEKMADRMVSCLCKKAEMPEEEREICRYGYEILISAVLETGIVLCMGMLLHQMPATIIFLVVLVSTRTYMGGYHAKTYGGCISFMIVVYGCYLFMNWVSIVSARSDILIVAEIMVFITGVITYAPIENKNKRLTAFHKQKYKEKSIVIMCIIVIIDAISFVINKTCAIQIGNMAFIVTVCMVIGEKVEGGKADVT